MIDLGEAEHLFNQLIKGLTTQRELKTREIGLALCDEVQTLRELVGAQKEYITILLQTTRNEEWAIAEQETREIRTKIVELEKEMG